MQSGLIPYGVGAKYAGMGGAGSALVDDMSCAYYNPAGIVKSSVELKIGAGAATDGLSDMIGVLGSASNPSKFIVDNYSKKLDLNGNINAIVGLKVAGIGLSWIPVGSLTLLKDANQLVGTASAGLNHEAILTLGYSLGLPIVNLANVDLGLNVKSANSIGATSAGVLSGTNTIFTDTITNRSGMGFDIGAKAEINTIVMPFSVAIVMKDIGETLKGTVQTTVSTYDATQTRTGQTSSSVNAPDVTSPTTLVIGAATAIPGIGLKVALDLDSISGSGTSYSLTHLGLEYPILGIVALRAGTVSGGPGGSSISQTTIGAGFNLGIGLNFAMIMDGKNSKNNSTIVDCGFAF